MLMGKHTKKTYVMNGNSVLIEPNIAIALLSGDEQISINSLHCFFVKL